jgi:hypothetical protein
MSSFTVEENGPILVEWSVRPGLQPVSLSPSQLAEKSAAALDSAMNTIHEMARRMIATVRAIDLADRPTTVEVEFGLKLDAEAGALVAKVATEAGITVKLVWKHSAMASDE